MANLLSGALGGLIGTIISSILSYLIFRKQLKIDSNRMFLANLIETVQNIYLSLQHGVIISDENIKQLISFQAVGLKEFSKLMEKITELNFSLGSYNSAVALSVQSTTTTSQEVTARSDAQKKIIELVNQLRKIT